MIETPDFSSIRPYEDHEIHEVFKRLVKEKTFLELIHFLYPGYPTEALTQKFTNINTVKEFQFEVIYPYVKEVLKNTTEGFDCTGLDKLNPKSAYLFISNHRDIVLDSAILNILLVGNGFDTTEIAIGDNLLILPWITDLVKLNRSFIVKRNIPVRQMMDASTLLSKYIRHTLKEKNRSIWIAQREGRSKDGDDRTQVSLLKMLNISGNGDLAHNFKELQIVPVSISYELDPCDYLKAYEFQQKRDNPNYSKTQADDLKHMGTGLRGRKGRVHFSIGTPIDAELDTIAKLGTKSDQLQALAESIDNQIHSNYKLWPGNFVACDIFCNSKEHADKYTEADKARFLEYINEHISRAKDADTDFIFQTLMEMYANPVRNFFKQ